MLGSRFVLMRLSGIVGLLFLSLSAFGEQSKETAKENTFCRQLLREDSSFRAARHRLDQIDRTLTMLRYGNFDDVPSLRVRLQTRLDRDLHLYLKRNALELDARRDNDAFREVLAAIRQSEMDRQEIIKRAEYALEKMRQRQLKNFSALAQRELGHLATESFYSLVSAEGGFSILLPEVPVKRVKYTSVTQGPVHAYLRFQLVDGALNLVIEVDRNSRHLDDVFNRLDYLLSESGINPWRPLSLADYEPHRTTMEGRMLRATVVSAENLPEGFTEHDYTDHLHVSLKAPLRTKENAVRLIGILATYANLQSL